MIVISRYLGRMGNPLRQNASCCLWQPCYYSILFPVVKGNYGLFANFSNRAAAYR